MRPSGPPSLRNEAEALTRPGCQAQKERLLAQRRVWGLCPLRGPLPATLQPALLALRPRGSQAQTGIWVLEAARRPRPASTGCFYSPSPQPCPKSCAESTGSGFKCKNQSLLSPAGNGPQGEEPREAHGAQL